MYIIRPKPSYGIKKVDRQDLGSQETIVLVNTFIRHKHKTNGYLI